MKKMTQQAAGRKVNISSPEELSAYMKVTSPVLWILLGVIVLLLTGFIVYACSMTMENTVQIRVNVYSLGDADADTAGKDEELTTYAVGTLPRSLQDVAAVGMEVRIAGEKGKIDMIMMGGTEDEGMEVYINLDRGYVPLRSGEYDAELVLERTSPLSFLWN